MTTRSYQKNKRTIRRSRRLARATDQFAVVGFALAAHTPRVFTA